MDEVEWDAAGPGSEGRLMLGLKSPYLRKVRFQPEKPRKRSVSTETELLLSMSRSGDINKKVQPF